MKKKTLEECFYQIRNGANIKQGVLDGGYPITRIETTSDGRFNRDKMGYAGITDLSKYESYVLEDGDLLMSHINSTQYLGRTVLYKKKDAEEKIIHGMNLLSLKANKDVIKPEYARYYFCSSSFKKQITRISKKSVNQASFSVADLKKLVVDVPSLSEQMKISEILDCVNEVIFTRRQELQKLDDLVKARFIEMFGDIITNEKKWRTDNWCNVLKIVNGKNQKAVESEDGEYLICGSGGAMGRATNYLTKENSVIIGRKGNINKPILMREKYWNVDTAFGIEPNEEYINIDYLYIFCIFFDFENLNKAVTIPSLTRADLLNIEMPIPEISVQNQFATFVEQVDKSKAAVQKSLDKLQILFDKLMQEYFG